MIDFTDQHQKVSAWTILIAISTSKQSIGSIVLFLVLTYPQDKINLIQCLAQLLFALTGVTVNCDTDGCFFYFDKNENDMLTNLQAVMFINDHGKLLWILRIVKGWCIS